eukprot:GILI01029364.1.p1 GENE.GILI01029364.1~~GILI01029364.1.p1  ORF type:complete len:280 (-),score=51.29 GILI01029364.1:32-748(-)
MLGSDPIKDEMLVLDDRFLSEILGGLLLDPEQCVTVATAQLIRKISEQEHICGAIPFTDSVMQTTIDGLTRAFETFDFETAGHLLCCFVNVTGNHKAHFGLARNKALINLLVLFLVRAVEDDSGGGGQGQSDLECGISATKALANLLCFPGNWPEMRASAPDITMALVKGAKAVESDPSDPTLRALSNAATIALEYSHDKGVESLEMELRRELQHSPAGLARVGGGSTHTSRRREMTL